MRWKEVIGKKRRLGFLGEEEVKLRVKGEEVKMSREANAIVVGY